MKFWPYAVHHASEPSDTQTARFLCEFRLPADPACSFHSNSMLIFHNRTDYKDRLLSKCDMGISHGLEGFIQKRVSRSTHGAELLVN